MGKGNESVCGEETMHGCHCAKSWDYMQETYEECSNTKNFDRRWCKIVDGLSCDGSQKLPDGNYFDTCWEVQTGDETVNGCKCKSKWEYNGENITRRCIKTGGHPKPWCAVKPGCAKAQAAGNGKDEWDTCKEKDKETEKEKETEKPEETQEKRPKLKKKQKSKGRRLCTSVTASSNGGMATKLSQIVQLRQITTL